MSKEELDIFLSGNIDCIGKVFYGCELSNNHRYKENEKYIHVFKYLKDLTLVQENRNFEYLVTFEIPLITLMASAGKGLYSTIKGGKYKQKNIREFAINVKLMKLEYFLDYKKIKKFEYDIDDIYKFLESGVPIENMEDFIRSKQNMIRKERSI